MFNLDHLQQDQYFLEHLLTMHSAVRLLDRDEAILPKDVTSPLEPGSFRLTYRQANSTR